MPNLKTVPNLNGQLAERRNDSGVLYHPSRPTMAVVT